MEELWFDNEGLISEEKWISVIDSLKSEDIFDDQEKVKKELREELVAAVKKRIPEKKFGIFFSGGVDSSLIAAICKGWGGDFVCVVVGFQEEGMKEPEDVVEARKVAEKLGLSLKAKVFDLAGAEEVIKKTVAILKKVGKTDVVNVGVGAVVLAAVSLGAEEGIDYFLGGLGSEEIFAGYERHAGVEDINVECWEGLRKMWSRDLVRDFNLALKLGVVVRTPFLDKELITEAMKIPGEWKLSGEKKKVILREVAEEWLGDFAWRKKKAAQYGSSFDKAIGKLAKRDGFKLKKEWLAALLENNIK